MHDVADRRAESFRPRPATKNQKQDARTLAVAFAGEILQDIIADQFLGGAMPRILRGHDALGVAPDEFLARGEHAPADQIEPGAGDEAGNDAAGARFAHRVGRDDDVGEFFGLHKGS